VARRLLCSSPMLQARHSTLDILRTTALLREVLGSVCSEPMVNEVLVSAARRSPMRRCPTTVGAWQRFIATDLQDVVEERFGKVIANALTAEMLALVVPRRGRRRRRTLSFAPPSAVSAPSA